MDVSKLGFVALSLGCGLCFAGCPADDSDGGGEGGSTTEDGDLTDATTDPSATSTSATTGGSTSGVTTEGGSTTTGPQETDTTAAEDDSSSGGDPPPGPTDLPSPTGVCPTLAAGNVVFAPEGIPERSVQVWMSDAADELDGPLVFYWHGTGSQPAEAIVGLGQDYIDSVVDAGGIVVAPSRDPDSGQFPWWLVLNEREDDLFVADEILGCALEQVGIDRERIHSAGMSAGGLQTSQMSYRRSNYLASVVVYSGGFLSPEAPPDADPENNFAAMSFHGGPNDVVIVSFQDATERYVETLTDAGRFAFLCDHGNGHTIPPEQESIARFLNDHPWGVSPFPYADALPDGFPDYCEYP